MTIVIGIVTVILLTALVALVIASLHAVSQAETMARALRPVPVRIDEPALSRFLVDARRCSNDYQ